MQTKKFGFVLSICFALSIGCAVAQSERNPQLDSLLKSTDSVAVKTRLDELFKSDKESDVNLVVQYYGRKNDVTNFERTRDIVIGRFPRGSWAHTKDANASIEEKDPVKKEMLVNALVQKYPGYDNAMHYFDVAQTYADQKGKKVNLAKVKEYAIKATNLNYRAIVVETLLNGGHLDMASALAKESLDTLKAKIASSPVTLSNAAAPNQMPGSNPKAEYNRYAMLYARILVKQGRPSEALAYAKEAYGAVSSPSWDFTRAYVGVLLANNELSASYPLIVRAYRLGQATPDMKAKLKDAYVSAKGSTDGYDQLLSSISAELRDSANAHVAQFAAAKMPAPGFTLRNIRGETISLEALKGKVIILDFWATWCGPCKRSFPAMQQAVSKYKDDKNVAFLFIDTWERTKGPLPDVKNYITSNKYSFNVLLDLQDPVTKKNNVVESYQVSGIPTKFVINKNGEIVYRLTGFSGGDDSAVEELSAMIESARS